ncbi:hypothetical protein OG762_09955 [Streptomyces sp. NBC_01136]|uniref:hypothetical protein n=1 Tax=Streptomyces sp. NBC_01136 TaxID=2903754 RepID=UPI003862F191|nr:hypothetical protein OG762_09955 [Streptomyces sp. NBC_01136]
MSAPKTPAPAGSNVNRTSSKPTTTDHPRVGGEHMVTLPGRHSMLVPHWHESPEGVITP